MKLRVRLVPLAILAAVALLSVKLGDLWSVLAAAPAAMAQAAAKASPTAAPKATAPVATSAPSAAAPGAEPDHAAAIDPLSMSQAEIDLLQRLSARRSEIDKRAAEV